MKITGLFVTIVAVALTSTSCNRPESAVLRIGVDDAPPYHLVKPDGSVEGMAVEIFNQAAKRRHIRIVWVPTLGSTVEAALASGQIDAWPAVSLTPERARMFHFTPPWLESYYYIVSRQGSGFTAQTIAGKRLALADFARLKIVASRFVPKAVPLLTASHSGSLEHFCAGRADAALLDARSLDGILLARPKGCGPVSLHLEYLPAASNPVSIASTFATARTADSLQTGIMALARDGSITAAIDKWTGFSAAQTRSFFALRAVESRRDLYLFGFALVTLSVIALGLAMSRLRVAQKKAKEAQYAAAGSEARFQAFMDNSPLVGFIKDEEGRMIYLNRRYLEVFSRTAEQCLGKNDFELWPAETAAELRSHDVQILALGKSVEFVETTPAPGGERISWLALKFPFRQGQRTYLGAMCIDITERERAKEALGISEERFRSLFSHAPVGIAIADRHGTIARVNPAFCRILGLDESTCLRSCIQHLLHEDSGVSGELLRQRAEAGLTFETWRQRGDATLWTENCLFAVRDALGEVVNIVVIAEDVTQRKIAEAQLAYQAGHDLLTGLTNRRSHETYLEEQIGKATETRRKICLLYIDLDDFKLINDSMGHDAGDLLLHEAARRLSSLVPDRRSLSRIGGDEFVLVQSVETRQDALAIASRLRQAMEQPFHVNGEYVELRASAGLSIYPEDGLDARTLRKKADDAMYAAKRMEKSNRYSGNREPSEILNIFSTLQ